MGLRPDMLWKSVWGGPPADARLLGSRRIFAPTVRCAHSTTKRERSVRVPRQLFMFAVGNSDQNHEQGTHGLVAMTSAQHAEGRQLDPGWVYVVCNVYGR